MKAKKSRLFQSKSKSVFQSQKNTDHKQDFDNYGASSNLDNFSINKSKDFPKMSDLILNQKFSHLDEEFKNKYLKLVEYTEKLEAAFAMKEKEISRLKHMNK